MARRLVGLLARTSLTNDAFCAKNHKNITVPAGFTSLRCVHASAARRDLMEFFDEKDNWSKREVRVGRSWRLDELRLKSSEDLHKLWFVLLKERNMLLTMEEEYVRNVDYLPSPERLDKVKESMLRLEEVVRERNTAYHQLEVGPSGERPAHLARNRLGMSMWYRAWEHRVPEEQQRGYLYWRRQVGYNRQEVAKFQSLLREKAFLAKRKQRVRDTNHVMGLVRRFPDVSLDLLQDKYPEVEVRRAAAMAKARGHNVPPS